MKIHTANYSKAKAGSGDTVGASLIPAVTIF